MPTIVEAIVIEGGEEKIITIDEALEQRDRGYLCPECREPIRPHSESYNKKYGAHFEHKKRNPDCSLSHKAIS